MKELLRFVRENDLRTLFAALNSRDVHPVIQVFKYGVCGVVATIVHAVVFFLSAKYLVPGLESNCPDQWERAKASLANNGTALLFSNLVAYYLNRKWVFTPGRHSAMREFWLFTVVNMPGVLCGGLVSYLVTAKLDWPPWAALAGFVLPNLLINFVCRKLFIFQR